MTICLVAVVHPVTFNWEEIYTKLRHSRSSYNYLRANDRSSSWHSVSGACWPLVGIHSRAHGLRRTPAAVSILLTFTQTSPR
ncbi:hypothetical protein RRG08_023524 [Elysia crispata]|uniref:Uncharacterized protein n=1 Tax=Elysia crispata TaxID=231223 RepID=A0AAE1D6S1_9GAST|nr:hypothetical protein RRG08_023524 [Elysia crispata]